MIKLIAILQSYKNDEEGATAIEYGLIAGGIALAIIGAVFAFGDDLRGLFENFSEKMAENMPSGEEE